MNESIIWWSGGFNSWVEQAENLKQHFLFIHRARFEKTGSDVTYSTHGKLFMLRSTRLWRSPDVLRWSADSPDQCPAGPRPRPSQRSEPAAPRNARKRGCFLGDGQWGDEEGSELLQRWTGFHIPPAPALSIHSPRPLTVTLFNHFLLTRITSCCASVCVITEDVFIFVWSLKRKKTNQPRNQTKWFIAALIFQELDFIHRDVSYRWRRKQTPGNRTNLHKAAAEEHKALFLLQIT